MNQIPRYIIDIETGADFRAVQEFLPPYPAFDPSTVATGNLKDPDKIQAKIEASAHKHRADEEKAAHDFRDGAALHAWTGEVLAVGIQLPTGEQRIIHGDERDILTNTWAYLQKAMDDFAQIVGFNIKDFDIPFLVRRGWKYGIRPPVHFISKDRYLHSSFIDLRDKWAVGEFRPKGSLDTVARHLGVTTKPSDFSGKDFADAWRSGDPSEVKRARKYLFNDLTMTAEVAEVILGKPKVVTESNPMEELTA